MKLSDCIRAAEKRLAAAGVDSPALDARLLAAHALALDRAQLLSQSARVLAEEELRRIEALIEARARRAPVSRILRTREFRGLSFGLNEATLDPRPDSETLIEAVLGRIRDSGFGIREKNARILDIGTGTGCLLLALLHELRNASGIGVDCAPRAAEQAKENAVRLGLSHRAAFRTGNWADGIDERFDLVISNPPYVIRGEISGLMPEVRDHDPRAALDGGADGCDAYRALVPRLPELLKPGGLAIFEIGAGQAEPVAALFRTAGLTNIVIKPDLNGIERCVTAMSRPE